MLNEHQFISSRVLGLDGTHQCENAALAFHVYRYLLPKFSKSVLDNLPDLPLKPSGPSTHCQKLSEQERQALMCVRWPGRCQILPVGEKLTFYLDGAHTVESIHVNSFRSLYSWPNYFIMFIEMRPMVPAFNLCRVPSISHFLLFQRKEF